MTINYSIAVDYDDDGNFTDLGDSITSEILSVEWQLGLPAPYSNISDAATATVVIRNSGRDFSPEVSTNIISKRLRIQSNDGTTTRTQFVGFIERVEPQAGNQGSRISHITVVGRERELEQHRVRLPIQTNVRADEAIADILSQIDWRYDILDGMCIIGRDSIGSSDIFPDTPLTATLDTGKSIFAFLADNWADGLPANEAIEQFAIGEGGRFFFNRDGEAVFYHRHHLLTDDNLAASFDDDMSSMTYDYGNVINDLELVITPRSIGSSNTKIWSLDNPIRIENQSTIEIIAKYEIDDVLVGAIELVPIKPTTHYRAYLQKNSTNDEMTDDFQVILREAGLSAAVLEIRNRSLHAAYLTQLDIHGTPLITGDTLSLKKVDGLSITYYGKRAKKIVLPVITEIDEAQAIANWEIQRRSQPRGRIHELQTNAHNHPSETLTLTLFDLIKIEETQTGHNANYRIIAEYHKIDMGGTRHQVNWLLEPSENDLFFIIGLHNIGDDVLLVPR